MAGSLLPAPKQQFFNDIGIPLFAGKIYTYAAGTLTPKATYQDQALTVSNTNPVIANARGEVVMYGSGAYRVILKDALENTIYDRDNITINDFASANGSESIGNGGETVAQSFNALQLPDYGALRSYVGPRKSVYVTGYLGSASPSGIAGTFVPDPSDTTSVDNGGTTIVSANNVRWKRQYTGGVDVRWWGAKFDGVTDDWAAHQDCVNYANPLQKRIDWPTGTTRITKSIVVPFSLLGINISGQGYQRTRIDYSGITPAVNAAIFITGHSGQGCGAVIEGIGFDGNATSSGIVISAQDRQGVRNCQFGRNANGVVFRNSAAGSFTEYCIIDGCDFLPECATAAWYSIEGSGDMSFHGSGFEGERSTCASPSTPGFRTIVVDPKALPYNSGLNLQVWGNAAGDIISMPGYTGSNNPYFIGNLTVEAFAPGLVGCRAPNGREVPIAGNVASANGNFSMGSLFMVDAAIGQSGGTLQTIGGRVEQRQALTAGANVVARIPPSMYKGAVEYVIHIIGPLYDYRYKVGTFATLSNGAAQILATYAQFNQAGYGAPTFSLDPTTGALVITNAAYPATGVSVNVSAVQVGQSVYDPFFS